METNVYTLGVAGLAHPGGVWDIIMEKQQAQSKRTLCVTQGCLSPRRNPADLCIQVRFVEGAVLLDQLGQYCNWSNMK